MNTMNTTDVFSTTSMDENVQNRSIYPTNSSEDWNILFQDFKGPVSITGSCIGIISNFIVLVVLAREANGLPRHMIRLLINQSFIDFAVCIFMANFILKYGGNWMTGIYVLDLIICYTLNCDMLYWTFAFISAHGLVCIASERYMAICRPFTYLKWKNSRRLSVGLCLSIYVYGIIVTLPYYLSVQFRDGVCLVNINGKQESGYYTIQPFLWLVTYYFIPVTLCASLYICILRTLQRSMNLEKHSENKTVSKASIQLTKTALTVTLLFVICVGIDTIPYVLVTIGYIGNTVTMHIIQLSCITINSMVNPFIYVITMPFFMSSLKRLFCCSKQKIERTSISD